MDKEQQQFLIKGFLKGKLTEAEEKELLAWVKVNEENKTLFELQQELFKSEITQQKNPHIDNQWNRLSSRIMSSGANQVRFANYRQIISIAASFVIGIVITALVLSQISFGPDLTESMQEVATPYGARTSFMLPDGSKVWLNSGSQLTYPQEFADKRPVKLSGEAFFEVKKGKKPFIVSTRYGEVEVLGTSFNVKAFDDEEFQTTLVSGLVKVKDSIGKSEATLEPGQQAFDSKDGLKVKRVEARRYISWKDGRLIFSNEYLPEIAKKLERWYNIKIVLDNPELNRIMFSGTIMMESFTEVMELLKMTSNIDYSYNEKTRTVNIKLKNPEDYEEVYLRK